MKRKIACYIATALLTLASLTAVHADELGYNGIGGTPSGGQRGNFKRGSVFTMPTQGVLDSLCVHGDGSGGSTARSQHYRIVLYADANGIPGAKLSESPDAEWLNSSVVGAGPRTNTSAVRTIRSVMAAARATARCRYTRDTRARRLNPPRGAEPLAPTPPVDCARTSSYDCRDARRRRHRRRTGSLDRP